MRKAVAPWIHSERGWVRLEIEADFLVGLFAETVAAFLDALERLVDLRDQLAIAVACAQFQRIFRFARRAFGFVADVAYFLAGALPREERRKHEKDYLCEYHERLREHGVDYDFETLWRDYRSRAFALFSVAFYASMIVTQTPRGDDMFMAMLHSATDQIIDLDALDFLR